MSSVTFMERLLIDDGCIVGGARNAQVTAA